MRQFSLEGREWFKATGIVYSICERHGIAFNTNVSEHGMWVRPSNKGDTVYGEIKSALKEYEDKRLVEVKEPHEEASSSREVIVILRK